MRRRDMIWGTATFVTGIHGAAAAQAQSGPDTAAAGDRRAASAADFGAIGDGDTDDTAALQAALDATVNAGKPGLLTVPPGIYKVSASLRIDLNRERAGVITRRTGISGHGAELRSAISDGSDVLIIDSGTVARFVLIEGLQLRGTGAEGNGLSIRCSGQGHYFYNAALRDVAVQGCGGDGCRMIGNIFESQIINSHFRDNKGNGLVMGHDDDGGVLSAIHVFGCVCGNNGGHGAALVNTANDVSFYGCYFLENGSFGLVASNGCTLLSHCGFENNHMSAGGFADGDAGLKLNTFGTLIGCTAYSIRNQTHLVHAYITNQLVMMGCSGYGGGAARQARLARLDGERNAQLTVIGSHGGIDTEPAVGALLIGQQGAGVRVGAMWDGNDLLWIGEHALWIDRAGALRMKRGRPQSETDGRAIGG